LNLKYEPSTGPASPMGHLLNLQRIRPQNPLHHQIPIEAAVMNCFTEMFRTNISAPGLAKIPPSRAYPVSLNNIRDHIRKRRLDVKLLQKDVAAILSVDTMTVNNGNAIDVSQGSIYSLRYSSFLAITLSLSPRIHSYLNRSWPTASCTD
jgi:hypothetical protein